VQINTEVYPFSAQFAEIMFNATSYLTGLFGSFGNKATNNSNPFGAAQKPAQSGVQTSSVFGSTQNQSRPVFPNAPTSTSGFGAFGQPIVSAFGTSAFGNTQHQPDAAPPNAPLFGNPQMSSGGLFGASAPVIAASAPTGGGSLFGASVPPSEPQPQPASASEVIDEEEYEEVLEVNLVSSL
jgi:hypothetical protein